VTDDREAVIDLSPRTGKVEVMTKKETVKQTKGEIKIGQAIKAATRRRKIK
jgi:hypothetical protein